MINAFDIDKSLHMGWGYSKIGFFLHPYTQIWLSAYVFSPIQNLSTKYFINIREYLRVEVVVVSRCSRVVWGMSCLYTHRGTHLTYYCWENYEQHHCFPWTWNSGWNSQPALQKELLKEAAIEQLYRIMAQELLKFWRTAEWDKLCNDDSSMLWIWDCRKEDVLFFYVTELLDIKLSTLTA